MSTMAHTQPERLVFHTSDGLTLIGEEYGDRASRPVILAHGGGQTRHAWGTVAKIMGNRGWHAMALDLRGHGESAWSESGDYALTRFAQDVREIAHDYAERPAIIGASLGGLTAMIAEGLAETPVFSAMVLVDVTPKVDPEGVARIRGFMRAHMHEGFASYDEAADAISAYLPHRPRPRDTSGLKRYLRLGKDGRLRWHWDPKFMENADHRMVDRHELVERAASNLKLPVLLVRGAISELVNEDSVKHFLEIVPHAEARDVAEAGHMVAGDQNDAFADCAIEFLERVVK